MMRVERQPYIQASERGRAVVGNVVQPNRDTAISEPRTRSAALSPHATARPQGHARLLRLQRSLGNAAVARMLVQRDDTSGAQATGGAPAPGEMTEMTVPVPAAQQAAATGAADAQAPVAAPAQAGAAPAASSDPATAPPPPVPAQAHIRAPVNFNFHLLPPELQVRLFEELNFTATTSAARIAWRHRQLQLSLGYSYGGAVTAEGQYRFPGAGTLSGSASYDPGSRLGSFSAAYQQSGWRLGANATTQGNFGASLGYGTVSPANLGPSIYGGEAAGRNLLGAVPGVLSSPLSLPGALHAHSEDIKAVQGAVRNIGQVADLRENSSRVDWGFYLNMTYTNPNSATATPGAPSHTPLGLSGTLNFELRRQYEEPTRPADREE